MCFVWRWSNLIVLKIGELPNDMDGLQIRWVYALQESSPHQHKRLLAFSGGFGWSTGLEITWLEITEGGKGFQLMLGIGPSPWLEMFAPIDHFGGEERPLMFLRKRGLLIVFFWSLGWWCFTFWVAMFVLMLFRAQFLQSTNHVFVQERPPNQCFFFFFLMGLYIWVCILFVYAPVYWRNVFEGLS